MYFVNDFSNVFIEDVLEICPPPFLEICPPSPHTESGFPSNCAYNIYVLKGFKSFNISKAHYNGGYSCRKVPFIVGAV